MRRCRGGDNFTVLVGHKNGPSDPSSNAAPPSLIRNTITFAPLTTEGGDFQNGAMVDNSPLTPVVSGSTGSFVVADNDFSTGPATIVIGPYRFTSFVDFIPGAGVNATATAIATAISNVPELTATANVATVSVVWDGSCDEVDFQVYHYGTKTNFSNLTPANGFLANGYPRIGAPVLSL